MLQKIINITDGFSSNSNNKQSFEKGKRNINKLFRSEITDSLDLSPASRLSKELNWTIENLKFTGEDKILILFSSQGFNFKSVIDLLSLEKENRVYLEIEKVNEITQKGSILLNVKIDLPYIFDRNNVIKSNLRNLNLLFENISTQPHLFENPEADIIYDLIDKDILIDTKRELEKLVCNLFILIEKISKVKIKSSFSAEQQIQIINFIDKVKFKNA